jgi:Arylsulfotransferase (ASST)
MRVNAHIVTAAAAALALAACGSASSASTPLGASADVRAAAANPVAVSPQPGTPDASARTQISFLGAAGTSVTAIRVRGSRSGAHTGALRPYSTGTGESFVPSRPFRAGERVTVTATIAGPAAGTARTAFTIAHQAPISQREFPTNPGDPRAVQHYSTEPSFTPSSVRVTTPARPGASPGYLFLAPYQGRGTPGPMIADQAGDLVWFKPLPAGLSATNLQVQSYNGKPVLTWWQGRILQLGFGQGEDLLYDSSYRQVARVRAGNGYRADLHEIRLTPEGTAWIDVFDPIEMNLSRLHGSSRGVLTDSIVQEVDVRTGLVMWEWHALGHVPLSESKNPVPHSYPWDYAHVNSADPGSSGDVLVSIRNTWTLYDVDLRSGGVRWRLGGSHSSFRAGAGTRFYWQHDAEWQPGGLISVFDNASDPPKERQTRGLLLAPDAGAHTVRLLKAFADPTKRLLAESQGNMQALPGGNWLLGYGRLPNFTEFDAAGHVLLDATLGRQVQNFKTFLSAWSGRPATAPAVKAAQGSGGSLTVAVSWNGATEVASWRVLAGASPSALAPVATAPKRGFETSIAVPGGPYVAVQALDAGGAVIGASAAVRP